jgi:L-ascorbate metabolism protein UlaG (beta-lactamase superfamily)
LNIKYLGHACFQIISKAASVEYSLLIDPFLSGNPASKVKAENVKATHVFVTHGHDDHLGDAISIATRCASTVYATVETGSRFPQAVKVEVGQIGGFVPADFGGVKFTAAAHGSSVPGGLACGFLIELEGKKIYHAGDTGLIMDMMLLGEEGVDVALLPIGDRFTMGPKDAVRAVGFIKPKRVVPMHYNTWPIINQDPELFKKDAEAATGTPVSVLTIGEALEC